MTDRPSVKMTGFDSRCLYFLYVVFYSQRDHCIIHPKQCCSHGTEETSFFLWVLHCCCSGYDLYGAELKAVIGMSKLAVSANNESMKRCGPAGQKPANSFYPEP